MRNTIWTAAAVIASALIAASPAHAGGYLGLAFGPGTDAVAEAAEAATFNDFEQQIDQSASGAFRLAFGYRFTQIALEIALWRAGANPTPDPVTGEIPDTEQNASIIAPGFDFKYLPIALGGFEPYVHLGLYLPSLRRELKMISDIPGEQEISTTVKRSGEGLAWAAGVGAQLKFKISGKMMGAFYVDGSRYFVSGKSSNGILVGFAVGGGL